MTRAARTKIVNFKVNEHEHATLSDAATRAGLSLSEWLRAVALAGAGEDALAADLDRAVERGAELERG